jgi:hypothetical protein
MTNFDKSHNSPYDRGSSDAYYGRRYSPHYYWQNIRMESHQMTLDQVKAYTAGYDEETDRKVW